MPSLHDGAAQDRDVDVTIDRARKAGVPQCRVGDRGIETLQKIRADPPAEQRARVADDDGPGFDRPNYGTALAGSRIEQHAADRVGELADLAAMFDVTPARVRRHRRHADSN